jgi:hypothetical protein
MHLSCLTSCLSVASSCFREDVRFFKDKRTTTTLSLWLPGTFTFFFVFPIAAAQFIQRYNNVNGVPHWDRQIAHGIPNVPVAQLTHLVVLEYNCAKLLSICINARDRFYLPRLPIDGSALRDSTRIRGHLD